MSRIVYIGLDDTDVIGSRGTGRVARALADLLVGAGLGDSLGVTRHQLLVDAPHQQGVEAMADGAQAALYLNSEQVISLSG